MNKEREERKAKGSNQQRKKRKGKIKDIESSNFVNCFTLLMRTMRTLDFTSDIRQI